GAPVHATFDLGNGTGTLVGAAYAERAGLLQNRTVTTNEGGGIGGAHQRRHITLPQNAFADRTFTDVPANIDDNSNADDLNLGVDILQNFHITTDFSAHRIWLQPND